MHYSYVEIEYVAMSFSPARMDLALKLLNLYSPLPKAHPAEFGGRRERAKKVPANIERPF